MRLIAGLSLAFALVPSSTARADDAASDVTSSPTAEPSDAKVEPSDASDTTTERAEPDVTAAAPSESDVPYERQRQPRPSPAMPAASGLAVPWARHLEVGGSMVFGARPADPVGPDRGIRYKPAIGFGLHATIPIVSWLFFNAYFIDLRHEIEIPNGALGPSGTVEIESLKTYSFGARFSPTLQWTPRLRTWITGGAGWGRMEFSRMTIQESTGPLLVGERASPFVEFPIGIGVAFEILPRWLIVHFETSGAFISNQSGAALSPAQGIDALGHLRQVGPFPGIGSSWVQKLGLSIVL
jgi:hypothetical protein